MLLHTTMGLLQGSEASTVNFILCFSPKILTRISYHQSSATHVAVICWPLKPCSFISQRANISVLPTLRLFVKLRDFNTHGGDSANTLASLSGIPLSSHLVFAHSHKYPNPTTTFTYGPTNTSSSAITRPDNHL